MNSFKTRLQSVFAVLSLIIMVSCSQEGISRKGSGTYFDLQELIDKEAERLTVQNPSVKKTVWQNPEQNIEETNTLTIGNWAEELKMFREADLNKPVLRDAYDVNVEKEKTVYTAKTDKLQVKKMEILHAKDKNQPEKILIESMDSNPLFTVGKSLELELQNGKIKAYRISGSQEVIMNDPYAYKVSAEILP